VTQTLSSSFSETEIPSSTVCISASVGSPEKSTNFFLPGGGQPAEGCGNRIPKHCRNHDGEFWGRSHCNERGCPKCFERWASIEGRAASLRVSWGAKFWQDQRAVILERRAGSSPLDPSWLSKKLLIGHFVISMSSEQGLWVHDWSPDVARALAFEIARRHHVCGGLVIFHPWRRDDDGADYVPDGYWHFHVIGIHFMPTSPGGSDVGPDGRTILFKHILDDEYGNYGGLRSGRAIARLIQYQLSHAGLREGHHALTYFGLLALNKLPAQAVESTYPESLLDSSKTNPAAPLQCPVCGSVDTEPCYETDLARTPSLTIPDCSDFPSYNPDRKLMVLKVPVHPEPDYEPSPEIVDQAELELEEKFQNLYDTEPLPAARHELTKERQRERAKLAQQELELFNMGNPLVAIWTWLKAALSEGSIPRDRLNAEDPALLDKCIELNLATGRLGITPGDRLYLKHEYDLDDALLDVRTVVLSDEPVDGRDWRLERLLKANPSEDNPILSDTGFVFGDTLDRLIGTNILGESPQPDRKIEGVWFKTAAGEIIEPGRFVEYLRKTLREDGAE